MMTRILIVCLVCFAGVSCTSRMDPRDEALRTDRFVLHSANTNDDYTISVWVPRGYQASHRDFPLLLMLDGEYSFQSAVPIADYLHRNNEVREFIIAAVSYDVGFGSPLAAKRSRDFTPPLDGNRIITRTESNYYRLLNDELMPALRSRYRIDPNDKTLWSYSLSGAFAIWLNYFDRSFFENYIIASPNSEYGIGSKMLGGEIFDSKSTPLKKVFMSMDRSEFDDKQMLEPEAPRLIKPLRDMIGAMNGYHFQFHITEGESHASSWFASLPKSLRFIFAPDANRASAPTTTTNSK